LTISKKSVARRRNRSAGGSVRISFSITCSSGRATAEGPGRPSRFEKGARANVIGWLNRWQKLHYEFHAIIVQPGFSKAKAEQSHLELFSATQSLLMDTWGMTLRILASP
jgi:hypothetical protein